MPAFWASQQHQTLSQYATQNARQDWPALCRSEAHATGFSHAAAGLRLDLARALISRPVQESLLTLAEDCALAAARQRQWSGELANPSEGRTVQHVALRSAQFAPPQMQSTLAALRDAEQLLYRSLQQSHPEHAVLHIGIGGSDLGPRLVAEAAGPAQRPLRFLNNLDDSTLQQTLAALDPRRTLVIVVSKSFATAETLTLHRRVRDWQQAAGVDLAQNTIAVTGRADAALALGVQPGHILDLPDWVGGRFSLWSAVSFCLALAYGWDRRQELLDGAAEMDQHFAEAPAATNLPLLAALAGLWHRNYLGLPTRVVVPYADRLRLLPEYLQQLEMESNGKSVDLNGQPLPEPTAPATFGGVGSCVQHAFFQLLHQGSDTHPVEFVVPARVAGVESDLQGELINNALAQACALTQGRAVEAEDQARACPGGRPSSMLSMRQLDLRHLGALLAFYEHRCTVQGWLWGLNSYDQFGVELGKAIARDIAQADRGERDYPDAVCAQAAQWLRGD